MLASDGTPRPIRMISIVVPLKDEPVATARRFEALARDPGCEIVAATEHRDAAAAQALAALGARLIAAPGSRGARLARGVREARGDVLFFVHADSTPPEGAPRLIRESLSDGADAGAFSLAYTDADATLRWIAWWANQRSRLLRLPFGDQGIFCRRETYERAGGFRDMPVCDDLDLVRRLKRAGRFIVRPETTTTSPRRYRERGPLRQVLRVWTVLAGYWIGVPPERLARWYDSTTGRPG